MTEWSGGDDPPLHRALDQGEKVEEAALELSEVSADHARTTETLRRSRQLRRKCHRPRQMLLRPRDSRLASACTNCASFG